MTVRGPTGGREVTATGLGLYQSCVGKVTSFTIETLGRPGKEFDVVISGPQGNAVPVRCYQHRDGNLLAEFTTNSVGKIQNNLFVLTYESKILKLQNYFIDFIKNYMKLK